MATSLIQSNGVETISPSITTTTGTLISVTASRRNGIVTMQIVAQNSSDIGNGGNVFTGKLSNYLPATNAFGAGYYVGVSLGLFINTSGNITIRNTGSTISKYNNVAPCVTYVEK